MNILIFLQFVCFVHMATLPPGEDLLPLQADAGSAGGYLASPAFVPLYGNTSHDAASYYLGLRPFDTDFPDGTQFTWLEPLHKCDGDYCWVPVNVATPPLLPHVGNLVYTGSEKIAYSDKAIQTTQFLVANDFGLTPAILCSAAKVGNGTYTVASSCEPTRNLPFYMRYDDSSTAKPHYTGWHSWSNFVPMDAMSCDVSCYATAGSSIEHCNTCPDGVTFPCYHVFATLENDAMERPFTIMLLNNLWSHCPILPSIVGTYIDITMRNRALPCVTGYYCPSPYTYLCDSQSCEQVIESRPCVQDDTKALCSHPYKWAKIPMHNCPPPSCLRMDNMCFAMGMYKCSLQYGSDYSVVPCDVCPHADDDESLVFKTYGDHIGYQFYGDIVTHRDFQTPQCSARLNGLAVHVKCNIDSLVKLCCVGTCVYGKDASDYTFPIAANTLNEHGLTVLHLGTFCTMQYGGRNDGFYLTDSPSYLGNFTKFTSLPYYIIVPFICTVLLTLYLLLFTCGLWYYLLLAISYVFYAFTFCFSKSVPPNDNNYCDLQYNGELCGASIKNKSQWRVHFVVFHGTWRHIINPVNLFYRWSFKSRTPLPAKYVGYYRTPMGIFRNGSLMGWFLTGILLSRASYVEAYTIFYNGQAQLINYEGTSIQLKAYSDIWSCTERGYTSTTTSTECSGHLACKASTATACSKLWPKGKLCNANWTGSKCCSFCWYHGCGLCDVNSYCGECYLKPGTDRAVAYQCVHKGVEFLLTVTCQGYTNDFSVTQSGTIDTPCGTFTINAGIHSPLTTLSFSYYNGGYFDTPSHCPFFRGNCADYRLECTSSVQQHGVIRFSCVAPKCVPYTKHQVANCQPSLDVVNRVLTLKSCAQGTTEIIFDPIVIEPINTPPTGLTVSECTYVSSSSLCYCRYTVLCDAVASYIDDVLYACGSETEGIVSCSREEACLDVGDFRECIVPDGIRLNDGVGLDESTLHSKSVTKTNWFIILIVIIAIVVLLLCFYIYWKFCRNRNSVDIKVKSEQIEPSAYYTSRVNYAFTDDVTDAFYRGKRA